MLFLLLLYILYLLISKRGHLYVLCLLGCVKCNCDCISALWIAVGIDMVLIAVVKCFPFNLVPHKVLTALSEFTAKQNHKAVNESAWYYTFLIILVCILWISRIFISHIQYYPYNILFFWVSIHFLCQLIVSCNHVHPLAFFRLFCYDDRYVWYFSKKWPRITFYLW